MFGNNDSKYHDNPIPDEDRDFFYNYTYNLWFKLLPGNHKGLSKAQKQRIQDTFMTGGYYRVDLPDSKISLLAMNFLYYAKKRDLSLSSGSGVQQMFWLKDQLAEESDRKFIVMYHLYPGARSKDSQLWQSYP